MDTITKYQKIVRQLMESYAKNKPYHGDIENELIMDEAKNHYELLHIGWDGERRVHGIVIHIDIIEDKVWVQYDGTAPGVAVELAEAGIPRSDIILGFHPPYVRQYTDFGVA